MNTLFIGIFDSKEPNTAMRNAFKKVSVQYKEIGWTLHRKNQNLQTEIRTVLRQIKFDLVFMQLQAADVLSIDTVTLLRRSGAFVVQWTGDVRQPLPKHYVEIGKRINLSLFTNQNDVDEMRRQGCVADYLQCGADHNIYTPVGSVTMAPKIVFMGNHYNNHFELSNHRHELVRFLKATYGPAFGVYGSGWDKSLGAINLMFKQEEEAMIYRSCMIAINCSHINLSRYTSDRFFRILMSGAFCLSREFPEMEEYGNTFVSYNGTMTDLKFKIDYYLYNEEKRKQIAWYGCETAHAEWTWDCRVKELLTIMKRYELDRTT